MAFAGFLAVLLFVGHSLVPAAKQFAPAWLLPDLWLAVRGVRIGLDLGLIFAVLGVAAMALGDIIVRWQAAALDALKERQEDRLRRVPLYRDDKFDKFEPFIGSGFGPAKDVEWISPAQDRAMAAPRRRTA
ncbi:MAG: hypothetical protein M3544_11150 [Pseudomonadota bacterium]|nr:hypothetical protein [Pseudomonadota bacterium]